MRHLATIFITLIMAGTCTALASAGEQDGPTGTWKVRSSIGRQRVGGYILKLHLDGQKVSGFMLDNIGTQSDIQHGSFVNDEVTFEVTRRWNGQEFTAHYHGTLVADGMQGTVELPKRIVDQTITWTASRTTNEEVTRPIEAPPVSADVELEDANLEAWRRHLLPDPAELAWEKIPWLTTFKDGILAADAAGMPLLLWTMNGHPLGCT